jgi:membrane protease YdiL (CAAX protease family)
MSSAERAPVGLRLKPLPILVVVLLGFAIPYAAAFVARLGYQALDRPEPSDLEWLYVQHFLQMVLALLAIAVVKRFQPGDYGLHLPRGKSYYGPALLWGLAFGVLMTVVDYAPQLIAGTVPDLGFEPTPGNLWGWLFFEGVYVGPTEEIPFRALLVTYLALAMPGRLRIGRFEMNWAGVIVALIFALLHFESFFSRDLALAIGQQAYAFALGVLYAYWLEKSRSVVAPIIGHNVGDVTEYLLLYVWTGVL